MRVGMEQGDRTGSSDRVRFWGRTYVGRGEVDAVVEAVLQTCSTVGLADQECRKLEEDRVEVQAVQTEPWREVWKKNLLQQVTWSVEGRRGALSVSADFRMLPRYAWRTVLGALSIGMAFGVSLILDGWVFTGSRSRFQVLDVALLVPACILAVASIKRLGTLGSRKVDRLWRDFIEHVELTGGVLEPVGLDSSRRYRWSTLAYFAYLGVVMVFWIVCQVRLEPRLLELRGTEAAVYILILAVLLLLVASLVLMSRYRGVGGRMNSIVVGFASSFSVLLLLSNPFLLWLFWNRARVSAQAAAVQGGREGESFLLGWFVISAFVFLALGTVAISVYVVSFSEPSQESLRWQARHSSWDLSRSAIGDRSNLRRVRCVFLPVWGLLGLLIVAGLLFAVATLASAVSPAEQAVGASLIGATRWVLASATFQSPQAPWIGGLARGAWCLYGTLVLTLLGLSTGQLWLKRRQIRRRLRTARPLPSSDAGRILQDLRRELLPPGRPEIHFAIRDCSSIGAWSWAFGFLGRERIVEVTAGAVEQLDREELAALVAHELAHHLHGQPRTDNRLRWLGRLTFTGDGFSLAVQHSFGYEQEADRTAQDLLAVCGIGARALDTTLRKIKYANRFFPPPADARDLGIPAVAAGSPAADRGLEGTSGSPARAESWRIRWRRRLGMFLNQYVSGFELHYWHPTYEERLAALGPQTDPESDPAGWKAEGWDL